MERLMHVRPDESYREQALEYIEEHRRYNSEMNGSGGLDRYENDYDGWLRKLENDAHPTDVDRVPAETYMLVRESDNRLIGMVNIRLELNDRLRRVGGHIGYGIRPTERRKGYNKINLYLALLRCQQVGLHMVLLDCDNDNVGSYRTMEALGGIEGARWYSEEEHCIVRRYMIMVDEAIAKYRETYECRTKSR